jgi:3',5'-cyclic AMP phosphodiesterase CpdA
MASVSAVVIGCLFCLAFKSVTCAADDPARLRELSIGQSYSKLIAAVQSTPPAKKFAFVVLGDSRGNMELASKIYHHAVLEDPAFILHTGDLVARPSVEEYLHYHIQLVSQIAPIPLIPVPGNHEKGPDNDFAGFRAIYGSDRFSFDFVGSRFVGVNNSGPDGLTAEDLRFIEQELAKPGAGNKFVIMHKPAAFMEEKRKTAGNKPEYRGFTDRADEFQQLMKRERVQAVFFGHDHGFAARKIDGIRYYITGGAGAELYSDFKWLQSFHHYIVVHVDQESLWLELVRLDGDQWLRSGLD